MSQESQQQTPEPQYVGFWLRFAAALIDTLIVGVVLSPLLAVLGLSSAVQMDEAGMPVLGADFLTSNLTSLLFTAALVIGFWAWKLATPGKMVISAQIVDAQTLGKPSTGQLVGRYFGYFVSSFIFGLGFLWVAFDARKQGWHDKLADTVVIKKKA